MGISITSPTPTGTLMSQTIPFNKVMQIVDTHFEQLNDSLYIFTLPKRYPVGVP